MEEGGGKVREEGLLHCTTKSEGKTVIFSRGSFLGRLVAGSQH